MTSPAPLTPSSPDWGTLVCDFCQRAPVSRPGDCCWNCQSYLEYLFAPRCDCPHDTPFFCSCPPDCEEDCPGAEARAAWSDDHRLGDGESASQAREAPERSEGEA